MLDCLTFVFFYDVRIFRWVSDLLDVNSGVESEHGPRDRDLLQLAAGQVETFK